MSYIFSESRQQTAIYKRGRSTTRSPGAFYRLSLPYGGAQNVIEETQDTAFLYVPDSNSPISSRLCTALTPDKKSFVLFSTTESILVQTILPEAVWIKKVLRIGTDEAGNSLISLLLSNNIIAQIPCCKENLRVKGFPATASQAFKLGRSMKKLILSHDNYLLYGLSVEGQLYLTTLSVDEPGKLASVVWESVRPPQPGLRFHTLDSSEDDQYITLVGTDGLVYTVQELPMSASVRGVAGGPPSAAGRNFSLRMLSHLGMSSNSKIRIYYNPFLTPCVFKALISNGKALSVKGMNTRGELGIAINKPSTKEHLLTPVPLLLDSYEEIKDIQVGGDHSTLLSSSGRIWIAGRCGEDENHVETFSAEQFTHVAFLMNSKLRMDEKIVEFYTVCREAGTFACYTSLNRTFRLSLNGEVEEIQLFRPMAPAPPVTRGRAPLPLLSPPQAVAGRPVDRASALTRLGPHSPVDRRTIR
jgi:hypothetical protein